jgi:phospholipase C
MGQGRAESDSHMDSDETALESIPEPSLEHAMDHVVLVIFENRSFDSLLGHLYTPEEHATFEGVIGKELKNPVPGWAPPIPDAEAGPEPGYVYYGKATNLNTPDPDPGEEYQHTNTQLFNILAPENRGKPVHDKMDSFNAPGPGQKPTMDGFVTDYISNYQALKHEVPEFGQYRQIMQGHAPDQVPVLSALARGFAVFDHWFSEVPSQTFPNRSFWTAATSSGMVVNSPVQRYYFDNSAETIFNRLEDNGRSWKVYVLEPCPISVTGAIHSPKLKPYFHEKFVPFSEFITDVNNGTLPDFALIEPNLLAGHADYHPPFGDSLVGGLDMPVDWGSAISSGEAFLARLYETVRNAPTDVATGEGKSNVWNTTLFIGWDEPGGTYDHVPPPAAVPPDGPDGPEGQFGFAFDRSGYRVPAIMVSPWVAEETVESNEFRHTSMIATLRKRWGLGGKFTWRDHSANTFDHLFTLEQPRQPETWPVVPVPEVPAEEADPFTFRSSLGSLGRHLVHGMAHLSRAAGYDVEPDQLDPDSDVEVPQQVFVDAARIFGGHFFTRLVARGAPTTDVPPGVQTTASSTPVR